MDDRDETVVPGAMSWKHTDYELTATDFADGACKAALSLLMKPSREPDDIRKALAWLTLAVGGQR